MLEGFTVANALSKVFSLH